MSGHYGPDSRPHLPGANNCRLTGCRFDSTNSAVVHLGEAEPVFHHPERVLDSGLQWRGPMVDLALPPWQIFSRNENATASDKSEAVATFRSNH